MPVLAVQPQLTQRVLELVSAAGWTPLRFNTGGRYGIPVGMVQNAHHDTSTGIISSVQI